MILAGVPGCGKSTYARQSPYGVICSADDFFIKDGVYDFKPHLLGQAHAACMSKFIACLGAGCPLVIVDNTNVQKWERDNYIAITELAGYQLLCHWWKPNGEREIELCAKRNSHKVPIETIRSMLSRFEDPSGSYWYKHCIL